MRLLVPLFIGIFLCSNTVKGFLSNEPYQFHLSEVNNAVVGFVNSNSAQGDRVRAVVEVLLHGSQEGSVEQKYLQLAYNQTSIGGTNKQLTFNIAESSAFYVDPTDLYIKVNDTRELKSHDTIEFYVYMADKQHKAVSNPLPFVVHIERPTATDSNPLGAMALEHNNIGFVTDVPYQFHLSEVSHAVAGAINIDTARGERVRAVVEELVHEEHEGPVKQKYLRLTYTPTHRQKAGRTTRPSNIFFTTDKPATAEEPSIATAQHHTDISPSALGLLAHPTSDGLAPITADDPTEIIDQHFSTGTLPMVGSHHTHRGHAVHLTHHTLKTQPHPLRIHKRAAIESRELTYNIAESSAFYVDPLDRYIKVNDTYEIEKHASVEFYVYLTNKQGEVVSNPLPFVVHIERPTETDSYPLGPAVFAGVLVLVIVFLALFIPFVTRAKRRYRQGKPVFKLGSHPSSMDLERASTMTMSRASSDVNWYGNNAFYSYEAEVEKERTEFSSGIKEAYSNTPTLKLHNKHKKEKETSSVNSGSSGIDVSSQYAEGTTADEAMSQRL